MRAASPTFAAKTTRRLADTPEHVRQVFAGTPLVLPATVLFLWFNRIETGETLFTRGDDGLSPFDRAITLIG